MLGYEIFHRNILNSSTPVCNSLNDCSLNDLVDNLSFEAKLFGDDISLFSVVYDKKVSAEKHNRDLETTSK